MCSCCAGLNKVSSSLKLRGANDNKSSDQLLAYDICSYHAVNRNMCAKQKEKKYYSLCVVSSNAEITLLITPTFWKSCHTSRLFPGEVGRETHDQFKTVL